MYSLYLTDAASKDYKLVNKSIHKDKILSLLHIIKYNPFQNPPPYKKLTGVYKGVYSRRINLQHRLFYQVYEETKEIKVLRMWGAPSS